MQVNTSVLFNSLAEAMYLNREGRVRWKEPLAKVFTSTGSGIPDDAPKETIVPRGVRQLKPERYQ